MKFLQKATLAAAIAVAPFAAQSLEALDDATLAATTGQAGVNIDITLQAGVGSNAAVQVGEIVYTDTAGASDGDGGSVSIKDVSVGTPTGTTINQTINVKANGDLAMTSSGADLVIGVGSVSLVDSTGAAAGGNLVDTVSLGVSLGDSTTTIGANSNRGAQAITAADGKAGSDVSNDTIVIEQASSLQITSGSMNALNGNVGVTGLAFYGGTKDAKTNASITQSIWADNNGVNIRIGEINGTLEVGGIALGGESIGSLAVSNIKLAGVTQTISGIAGN